LQRGLQPGRQALAGPEAVTSGPMGQKKNAGTSGQCARPLPEEQAQRGHQERAR